MHSTVGSDGAQANPLPQETAGGGDYLRQLRADTKAEGGEGGKEGSKARYSRNPTTL
jgi:hypothetical protein